MNIAVIFAGGIGRRMNTKALPKQFLKLHGKEIIVYTLEHFQKHEKIDKIVLACLEEGIPLMNDLIRRHDLTKVVKVVPGGETGQESIYNGLLAAKEVAEGEKSIVLIHDGVRPLIDAGTITDCVESVLKNGSAVTTAPANETIILAAEGDKVDSILQRSSCRLARAPQCFYLDEILEAHRKAHEDNKGDFVDSSEMMKYYGHSIYLVEGPIENIKITTPMDFYTFRAMFEARENSQLYGF